MTTPAEYVARGWQIFPCHAIQRGQCTCSRGINCPNAGKHPLTHNGVKDATRDLQTIQAWQARWPFANWAVACGRSTGFIVLDVDPRHGGFDSLEQYETERPAGPLPSTLSAVTGGGGRHMYFTYPTNVVIKNDNRGGWLTGVDVKSDGGYVLLPESSHISGGSYSWINWMEQPAQLPPDVVSAITERTSGGSTMGDLPNVSDLLKGVPEGKRDDTLFREACRLRRQLGDESRSAVELLILEAARNSNPPFPEEEARKCVDSAWRQDHSDNFVEWQMGEQTIHPQTDLGNALRFKDAYGNDVLYVGGWGWMVWTDVGWQRDATGRVAEMTHSVGSMIMDEAVQLSNSGSDLKAVSNHFKWGLRTQGAGAMHSVLEVAKDFSDLRRTVDDFDSVDHLIVCRNGVVDLRTGELRSIDRDDLVTKNAGVVYELDCQLKEWEDFILEACDGDVEIVQYLQRAAGYTLTGSNKEEAFFLVSGPPASGKSTFLDGLQAALGSYSTSTQADTFMWSRGKQPPTLELARMAGVRLVSMSEIKEGASFDENMIKTVTGGDPVTAKFLYENPFTFRPKFKLWIGTNHEPRANDDALWRRIKKITFPNSIPYERRNPKLKIMLRNPDVGGKAVLAWAVRGAIDWYQRGLAQPASVSQAIMEYRVEQDHMTQFISECLQRADGQQVSLGDVYNAYRMWCQTVGLGSKPRQAFAKLMRDRGMKAVADDYGRESYINYKITVPHLTSMWS